MTRWCFFTRVFTQTTLMQAENNKIYIEKEKNMNNLENEKKFDEERLNSQFNLLKQVKQDSIILGSSTSDVRNSALKSISSSLVDCKDKIFEANLTDLRVGRSNGLTEPILKRLEFDEKKLRDCIDGIHSLIGLDDPLNKIVLKKQLDEGLILSKVTCPIGVIGVIFESRPDALVQIASLCVKSGNASVLKGGSEAVNTNRVLFDIIRESGIKSGLPDGFTTLVETRESVSHLLKMDKFIDLIIPRGSNAFVRHIMANSSIPVMGHADGICHVYVAEDADVNMALKIIEDSKTQYPVACNALETLLVHEEIYDELVPKISDKIIIREGNFSEEYSDYIMTLRKVANISEAIDIINENGSHHTDCIVTSDPEKAEYFMNSVDSAGVYHNCSTRFADGFRYGFGAEVGISTGKLHARGPVGLDGLVTYKYKLFGNGQIVGDYATGKSSFKFKDLF